MGFGDQGRQRRGRRGALGKAAFLVQLSGSRRMSRTSRARKHSDWRPKQTERLLRTGGRGPKVKHGTAVCPDVRSHTGLWSLAGPSVLHSLLQKHGSLRFSPAEISGNLPHLSVPPSPLVGFQESAADLAGLESSPEPRKTLRTVFGGSSALRKCWP